MHEQGHAGEASNLPPSMPITDDEIREKYLERAIRELNTFTRELQECEHCPRGMTLQETIAEIRRQGGLVYVPHPFDRMHSVPDYEHLLDVVEQVDAIEVFNPRVAFSAFNEEAERFAAKYRIVAGAGSDSHVAAGLGSVKIRMRDFDGPEEFLESLRDADIVRKKQSLLYVQALKFIQTRGKK